MAPVLDWYADAARDLPWRRPGTSAWAVLVSELMLQQTPVTRVLPVWREWLERWPDPAALAADSPGAAVRAWGRLGYPRRALRLHASAVAIERDHGGVVPATVEQLLALPGVGEYTARAVVAFAFGGRVPVVDTNVRRVLARAHDGRPEAGSPRPVRDQALAAGLLPFPSSRAARWSVAVMELGALICTARAPGCAGCPLLTRCAWVAAGRPAAVGERRPAPGYAGTDRQARGRLLAVLRADPDPVPRTALDLAWPDPTQRDRALASLLTDGLVTVHPDGRYALP